MADFADRFILRPPRERLDGPMHVQQTVDDATAWYQSDRPALYELFHENTKFCPFDFASRAERKASLPTRAGIRYNNAKDFGGFPSIALWNPDRRIEGETAEGGTADAAFMTQLADCLYVACGPAAARGFQDEDASRANYSVDNLYPVDIYIMVSRQSELNRGCYYYHPVSHRLYRLAAGDPSVSLRAAGVPASVEHDGVLVILVGAFQRTVWRFGNRGYRYTLIETGMVVERLCQAAARARLRADRVPAFIDDTLHAALGINGVDEAALFCLALGSWKADDSGESSATRGSR